MLRLFFVTVVLASTLASAVSIATSYHIERTWNGGKIDHEPIKVTLEGDGKDHLLFHIEAPFFNDPPNPGGKRSQPFFGLWNYEVVEAFFLNDKDQYLEVEVAPWGQHIVLMFKGERQTIRHSLPLSVETTIQGDKWSGTAKIPFTYLPPKVTKFNAYAIHGTEPNRIYEALHTAPDWASKPDFHALQYFSDIDLSPFIPSDTNSEMSKLWQDALNGLFRYRVTTTWNGKAIDHPPLMITLQGFQDGIEMNITAPIFSDSALAKANPGPLQNIWEYEVVEMIFANEKGEFLHVSLAPGGHHQVMLLKDSPHTPLKSSLPLDFIVSQDPAKSTWKGSALIPQSFFPPSVDRMNAYFSHGSGSKRSPESLYPAPSDSRSHDKYKLEHFTAIDFEFLEPKNPKSDYSSVWAEAMNTEDATTDNPQERESETVMMIREEEEEATTMLGPSSFTTPKPNRQHLLRRLDESAGNKQQQVETSIPGRDQGHVDVKQQIKGHPLQKKQDPPQEEDLVQKEDSPQVTVLTKEDPPQVIVLKNESLPLVPILEKEDPPQVPVITEEESIEETLEEPLQDPLQETEGPLLEEDPLQDLFPSTELDQTRPVLPPPHSFCIEEGLIRDFLRCQVFHECVVENNEWRVYHWRCPRGQYFDQEKIACLPGLIC